MYICISLQQKRIIKKQPVLMSHEDIFPFGVSTKCVAVFALDELAQHFW